MKLCPQIFFVFFIPVYFSIAGCVLYPELVEKGMNAPKSERCGDCHIDIYDEWKDSPHARSFTNPLFKEETNGYQFTFCLGCHAPETIFTEGTIGSRDVNREEGVHCNGCHLNDCALTGPTPARGPHPIAGKNPFFRTSELCGKCHVGTYNTWRKAEVSDSERTCQSCHMPGIRRKLIQDEPWQKFYPKREGRQHFFSNRKVLTLDEKLLRLSFKSIRYSEGKIEGVLQMENRGIPHGIPTGDYGYREVVVRIELRDNTGRIIDFLEESLFVERKTALQYKEKRDVRFCFPGEGESYTIRATMTRTSFRKDVNILLAEKTCYV
ncbi:MAG: cytochrome c family protein [Candidatus Brocadiaceae bacterium]|nr:cytochrome c family protein [Candidatus Brocadiaceae bacterium]